MSQPTGQSGSPGQPPAGGPPPSWQQAPQAPVPPQAAPPGPPPAQSWQQAPQQPVPPVAPPYQPPSWTANLTSTVPVPGPAGFIYGDVPNRAIAFIIDYIVMAIVGLIIGVIALGIFGDRITSGATTIQLASAGSQIVSTLVSLAIVTLYFWFTWTRMRGTVGMKLLSMQIGHEVDGQTIDDRSAIIRIIAMFGPGYLANFVAAFALGLSSVLGLVAIIWFFVLLYTTASSPTKQGLHDQYAHTMVVKAARRAG